MDWFTSDLHLNHIGAFKFRNQFSSIEEMNNTIIKNFDCVKKGDRLFLLGDLGWDVDSIKKLLTHFTSNKIHVFWIRGNHDKDEIWKINVPNEQKPYLHKCDSMKVKATKGYSCLFLNHYPCLIWDKSHYGSCHLYGHSHSNTSDVPYINALMQGKCLNVNIELHDYKPWSRDEIQAYMNSVQPNIDYYLCKGTKAQKKKTKKFLFKIKKQFKKYYSTVYKLD